MSQKSDTKRALEMMRRLGAVMSVLNAAAGEAQANATAGKSPGSEAAGESPENEAAGESPENAAAGESPQSVAAGEDQKYATTGIGREKVREVRKKVCAELKISDRTLSRWIAAFKAEEDGGTTALLPKQRENKKDPVISKEVLARAIELRRELPTRSVNTIIQILEREMPDKVPQGSVKRATLQKAFQDNHYAAHDMRVMDTPLSSRFIKTMRNELWMGDLKDGPYLVIDGQMVKTHLSVLIDDYSRHVVYAKFYPSNGSEVVEDTLKNAILRCGVPQALYFDNGKQYKSKWMSHCCEALGIKLMFCKPYSPQSKGVVERLMRTVNAFLDENSLKPAKTLDELNTLFEAWLLKSYERVKHSTFNETPEQRFYASSNKIYRPSPDVMALAFMHMEKRQVSKTGEVWFYKKSYFAGKRFAYRTVDIFYHPDDLSELWMRAEKGKYVPIHRTYVGPFVAKPEVVEAAKPVKPSNLLGSYAAEIAKERGQEYPEATQSEPEDAATEKPVPASSPAARAPQRTSVIHYDVDEDEE
ncbi:MAG: DDE-type integrase/transposase/recombinase [Clostridia bacterium]|nr:DDE-type integrase/transposase/recombinase [Clostridia bacterium]